ncbi:MAG: hypothetical protein GX776_02670 [Oxalobacter sp.]|nr:hypothetical protein [Oxalobacter sp.]
MQKRCILINGLEIAHRKLETISRQTQLYADIGFSQKPDNQPLQTSIETLCGTMDHITDQVKEAISTINDMLDLVIKN